MEGIDVHERSVKGVDLDGCRMKGGERKDKTMLGMQERQRGIGKR